MNYIPNKSTTYVVHCLKRELRLEKRSARYIQLIRETTTVFDELHERLDKAEAEIVTLTEKLETMETVNIAHARILAQIRDHFGIRRVQS